jgi:hypothetical protein
MDFKLDLIKLNPGLILSAKYPEKFTEFFSDF